MPARRPNKSGGKADIPQRLEFTTSDILSEFEVQLIAVDATGNWRIGKKTVSTLPQGAE